MNCSNLEGDLRRRPTSRRLPSDELRDLVSSRPREVTLGNTGLDAFPKSGPSSTNHIPSHYYDLRQLQAEEDLIQFNSRPPTPQTQSNPFDASVRNQRDPRLQTQTSLLDLEDPPAHRDLACERSRYSEQFYELV